MTAFSRQAWIRPGRPPYLLLLCGLGTGAAIAASGVRRGAGVSAPLPSGASQTADPSALRATGVPWVVLPTFNEAENLERIVAAVVSALEQAARPVATGVLGSWTLVAGIGGVRRVLGALNGRVPGSVRDACWART